MGFLQVLRFHLTVQKHTHLLDLELLNAPGCESIFVSWYIELRSTGNFKRPYIQTVCPPPLPYSGKSESDPRQEPLHIADVPNNYTDKTHESIMCFSFSFVSLWKDTTPPPLLILALTVGAHCQLRLKHFSTFNLLLSLCLSLSKTKINQSMLRLQAASVCSLKSSDWSGGGAYKQWSDMELLVHESVQVVMQISSRDIKIE